MRTRREASRPSGEADQLVAEIEVCELRDKDRRPRVLARCGPIGAAPARPDGRPPAPGPTSHALGRHPPRPGPAGCPGRQLLGLEPRRRRRAPNGRAGSRRAGSRASYLSVRRRVGARSAASAPPPRPRTLTPPTRSHTIPEASGARAFCRSGAASRPGPEMAAEQRESGLGRAPVRLAGGRSPARESSAAVALATAAGLGKPRPGPAGLRRAAHDSGFPSGPRGRGLGPAPAATPRPRGPAGPAWDSVAARAVSVKSRCRALPGGDLPRPHLCPPL